MPELSPFRGLRYEPGAGDLGDLLAPPYDVIAPEEAADLRGRSPHNCVRLILPEGTSDERYRLAARRLTTWRTSGVLRRDRRPSAYVYEQAFRREESQLTRRGLFAVLRVVPPESGEVLPHEETHREPRRDRLALTRACAAQLSPVFLLAHDPGGKLLAMLEESHGGRPSSAGRTPDGIRHRLWRIRRQGLARELCGAAGARPLLIADGHHRYETALELAKGKPPDHPATAVLVCVVSDADPGLLCLPTHRTLTAPPDEEEGGWDELLRRSFHLDAPDTPPGGEVSHGADPVAAADMAAREEVMVAWTADGRMRRLRPRKPAMADAGLGPEAMGMPPVLFDRLVLRRLYGTGPDEAVEAGLLSYHRSPGDAAAAATGGSPGESQTGEGRGGGRGAAFFLPSLPLNRVREAARRGRRLPPKSTFFWPKIPSGLLFRPLD